VRNLLRLYSLGTHKYAWQAVPVLPEGRVHLIGVVHTGILPRPHDGTAIGRTTLQLMACAGSENPMLMPETATKPSATDTKTHFALMDMLHPTDPESRLRCNNEPLAITLDSRIREINPTPRPRS
jgi:hypothetical protein